VLSYLCAGRALLAAVPSDNLAAEIVRRSGAGFLVEPGDKGDLVACATRLLADGGLREVLGRRARRYAEQNFDVATIGDRFEPILDPGERGEGQNGTNMRHEGRREVSG
jgi:glycosyltransferase involved in cell wall biosynthesis